MVLFETGAGSDGVKQGCRPCGEPPEKYILDVEVAKSALVQRAVCLPTELPKMQSMYFALLNDGYTLPEAVAFVLAECDTMRLARENRQEERYAQIRNPETRPYVTPENTLEAESIAHWNALDDAERIREEGRGGQSLDESRAKTDEMMRDLCDLVGGDEVTSSDQEINVPQAEAAKSGAGMEQPVFRVPDVSLGKKKAQKPVEEAMKLALPPRPPPLEKSTGKRRSPMAVLRSLFS